MNATKKEDFRRYLERNGVVDTLTKVLVGLYEEPEKPDNPTEYIKTFFTAGNQEAEIAELKAKVARNLMS